MSDRMTSCRPRHIKSITGWAEWGRRTRPEMITAFRRHYEQQLTEAKWALELTDDELIVETYLGVHVERMRKEVTE